MQIGDRVRVAMVDFSDGGAIGMCHWKSETIRSYLKVFGKVGYVEDVSDHGCIGVLFGTHGYTFCAEELRVLPEEPMLTVGARVRVEKINFRPYFEDDVALWLPNLGKVGVVIGGGTFGDLVVEFSDGCRLGFWSDDLEPIA